MDHKKQALAFRNDIMALVDRYAAEFDLTMAQAIGVLEIVKMELWREKYDELNNEDETEEE